MTCEFKMAFVSSEGDHLELQDIGNDEQELMEMRQDLLRTCSENGYEIQFLPNNVMRIDQEPEDFFKIISAVMKKHGASMIECQEVDPQDLEGYFNEPDFGENDNYEWN